MIELQHTNLKFYITDDSQVDPEEWNPVFQTWIQNKVSEEVLIDVADYLHVPEGPGMVLVGLEADYALDQSDGRWGLKYNRKAPLDGSNQDRLLRAFKTTLEGCDRIEQNEILKGKVKFRTDEFEIFFNDRGLVPNTPETLKASQPELESALEKLIPGKGFSLEPVTDPRERFGVTVKISQACSIQDLLKNL